MQRKIIFYLFISLLAVGFAMASSKDDIVYPVVDLGNCKDKASCFIFCNDSSNIKVCISFAKKHNLMSEDELDRAEEFAEVLEEGGGPGGCQSEQECRAYCEKEGRMRECLEFARDHELMDDGEREEAEKVLKALESAPIGRAGPTHNEPVALPSGGERDVVKVKRLR